jgi:hypothetical protein
MAVGYNNCLSDLNDYQFDEFAASRYSVAVMRAPRSRHFFTNSTGLVRPDARCG